ncbi:MAG: phosphoesterase, partial [Gammaproteobacteria bacterium]|nr:phosphoesterase [Gammaproteobacteria bacterium]
STCAQFTPESSGFAIDDKPPGFRWLELYQDGTLRSDVVWLNE